MAHFGDGAAVEKVAEQAVAVTGHRDQITIFAFGGFDDFRRRVAERQHGFNWKSVAAKLAGDFFQILAVVFHFLGLGEFELVEIARHPAVGDVQQQQICTGQHRASSATCGKDGSVRRAVFEGDEDFLIHGVLIVSARQTEMARKTPSERQPA